MRSVLQPGRPAATPPSGRRRALRVLSTLLLVTGVLVVTDAILTVTWQEPLTSAVAALRQDKLNGQLEQVAEQGPTMVERRALARIAADAAATAETDRESA